jgi:hypothetical protein
MNAWIHHVRIVLVVGLVTAGAIAAWAFQASSENTIKTYVLSVAASAVGQPVDVVGAVWVSGSQDRVDVVRQATPIELRLTGNTVAAILKSSDGRAIRVELREADSMRSDAAASGGSVVLGKGLAPNVGWGFAKAF